MTGFSTPEDSVRSLPLKVTDSAQAASEAVLPSACLGFQMLEEGRLD